MGGLPNAKSKKLMQRVQLLLTLGSLDLFFGKKNEVRSTQSPQDLK